MLSCTKIYAFPRKIENITENSSTYLTYWEFGKLHSFYFSGKTPIGDETKAQAWISQEAFTQKHDVPTQVNISPSTVNSTTAFGGMRWDRDICRRKDREKILISLFLGGQGRK
ncbi:hypothetical protein NPIL_95161 [Nephila pilipes]|uniref:Uncharacterized protein n=1 Tax=Nephila pilipes TaxID=299642 RepID=A0A8X6P4S2_NEPPI|nr:hypothetical protein NPIL_95161 [Nephila pilipes]